MRGQWVEQPRTNMPGTTAHTQFSSGGSRTLSQGTRGQGSTRASSPMSVSSRDTFNSDSTIKTSTQYQKKKKNVWAKPPVSMPDMRTRRGESRANRRCNSAEKWWEHA